MLIRPLSKRHDTKGFDGGNGDLNRWLVQIAGQHRKKLISKTFVAAENETARKSSRYYAIGFYQRYGFETMADHPNRMILAIRAE
jgi:hypothetical protein